MAAEFNTLGRLRVQRRMKELLNEHRPNRYVVDDNGGAEWMNKPVEILMEEFGDTISLDVLHSLAVGEVA